MRGLRTTMLDLLFYAIAVLGCGSFFAWLTRSVLRLREHEHKQNNALHTLLLRSEATEEHLLAIRRRLRIPGMTES